MLGPQTARAPISNPVSGEQCHIIHITILSRFSWLSLAYMCAQRWPKTPFISFRRTDFKFAGYYLVFYCWGRYSVSDGKPTLGQHWLVFAGISGLFSPLSPRDALKHHFTSSKADLIFLQQRGLERKFMAIFFTFSPTSNHLHPLQVKNCGSNSKFVVDEDDNHKVRLRY